ncbi:hypothetical protein N7509_005101 [Penicillium cosmopolitanum]|uniref:Uncharacterized protein n=1 Tax=Penicillium cosmopolitanum TaxID=1131564 RepID=A0A9W9W1T2_9EURO|nr:uncharacterized protein N7509_005101 [Penicillium cosmopolitanum]KAJ5396988.1 hypothetical protein N7509_005101 [Penicillium cosmopolitanum]
MNWTGGQLRRHSDRKGTLSQTQRQNFAKSRQRANDRGSRQPVSFPGFLNLRDELTVDEGTELVEERQDDSSPPLNTPLHNSSKHRFLQNPDWAAVSLSRPLSIKFAPVEEVERFGKRRRLNDADRQRLSTAYGRPIPALFHSRRKAQRLSSERDVYSSGQIQIQIDGQPTGLHLQSNIISEITPSHHSSESIMLGQSISAPPHSSAHTHQQVKVKSPWQGLDGLRSSLDYPANASRASRAPLDNPRNNHTTRCNIHDQNAGSTQRNRQTLTPPGATNPSLPRPFTIDGQVLTKQRGLDSYSDTDQHDISRSLSLVSTLIAFPLNETQHASSWRPEPRLIDTPLTNHPSHDTDFSGLPEAKGVRVFGQLVRLNTDAGISTF